MILLANLDFELKLKYVSKTVLRDETCGCFSKHFLSTDTLPSYIVQW